MEKLRSLKPNIAFHLLLNVVVVLFITGASYYHTPLVGFKDTAIYFVHLCALQTTLAGLLYFLSLQRWVFSIGFSTFFVIYAGFAFWAYSQDISVTPGLIQAVIETKPDIAADLITWPFVLFYLFVIVVLYFLLKLYRTIHPTNGFRWFLIPALGCFALFFYLEQKRPGSLKNRLPYNVVQGMVTYFEKPTLQLNTAIERATKESDSLKVVFVLGETVRADHLGLNGYERETTPLLSEARNLISFTNLFTSNTYTGSSVPQILTDEPLSEEHKKEVYTSVYSVAAAAGVQTKWIGNQTLEKSFEPIVYTNESVELIDAYKSEFSFRKALDEALLPSLDAALKQSEISLTTLHMMGSHWYYENRYTDDFRRYTPVIDSKYVPSLTRQQMINSYDNTILYLDFFLADVIERLKQQDVPTAMIYVSDHGELLGEGGKYLHAQTGAALENPGYIIWFSESYKEKYPEVVSSFSEEKNQALTTDTIFYSILEILRVQHPYLPKF